MKSCSPTKEKVLNHTVSYYFNRISCAHTLEFKARSKGVGILSNDVIDLVSEV